MHREQLEYFTLTYKTRNYSAAAKLVPMSPQGLTKSIHSLENELGVSLFKDVNGALMPTPYADEMIRFVHSFNMNYSMLEESFLRIQALENHEIRLGSSLGILGFIGTEFIKEFERTYPYIHIVYNESNDVYCERGLLRGSYDLALTLAPYDPHLTTAELYTTQVYLWVNRRNSLSEKKSIMVDDLKDTKLGLPGEDFKIYQTIIGACERQAVLPREVFAMGEIFWLYDYVSKNRGLAFTLPHLAALPVFSAGDDIVALPLEGIVWSFGISYLSSRTLASHENLFFEYCVERVLSATRSA